MINPQKVELVGCMLHKAVMAQLAHWKTPSYAAHMALGSFYDELGTIVDMYAEVLQREGLIQDVVVEGTNTASIIKYQFIEDLIMDINNVLPISTPAESNILENALTLCYQTLYKLNNLS